MNPLNDFIDECMDDTGVEAGISEFQEAFCKRCLNPTCKRSRMNDLLWKQRMHRQADALYNPTFGDPNDPSLKSHAEQDFKSFEKQTVTVPDWESFSAPSKFQEKVVHHAEADAKTQSSEKIDDNVSQLATAKGKDVPRNTDDAEPVVQEEPRVEEPVEAVKNETPEEAPPAPEKPVAERRKGHYNTEVPSGGILMKPKEEVLRPSTRVNPPMTDAWSAPGEKKKLVVRASDGKRVDKAEAEGYKEDPED